MPRKKQTNTTNNNSTIGDDDDDDDGTSKLLLDKSLPSFCHFSQQRDTVPNYDIMRCTCVSQSPSIATFDCNSVYLLLLNLIASRICLPSVKSYSLLFSQKY